MTEDRYLTVDDVALVLRKHPRTIRDWIVSGCVTERGRIHLDATKVGKSWLIHPEWLELLEHRIRPAQKLARDYVGRDEQKIDDIAKTIGDHAAGGKGITRRNKDKLRQIIGDRQQRLLRPWGDPHR